MPEFLKKYRVQLLAGLALFAALIFYSLNLRHRDATSPFERVVLTVTTPVTGAITAVNNAVRSVWEGYVFLTKVKEENRRMLQTIKIQNERLIRGNEALLENERLRSLLEMKDRLPGSSVVVSVIAEEVTPWFRTVVINRGAQDGIREGLPVVAVNGVVGQVIKVGATSAKVLLLTDHASAIAATIQRSRARGVVKGKGGDLCSLEFASRQDDIKLGDIVITSGIGGVYPKGIPIGEVTMVKKGDYGIFQTVTIRPSVNLSRLEELLVLVSRTQ
jgi:rod shape-determining protein MreC